MFASGLPSRCSPRAGVAGTRINVITPPPDAPPLVPPWRVEILLMAAPFRCMASGRRGCYLALRLTPTALGPFTRPILLDPAAVARLIDSALDILGAGIDRVTGEDDEW